LILTGIHRCPLVESLVFREFRGGIDNHSIVGSGRQKRRRSMIHPTGMATQSRCRRESSMVAH